MVCRAQKAGQYIVRNRVAKELATHIAALEDTFVHGIPLGGQKHVVGLLVIGFHGVPFMGSARPPVHGGAL